VSRFFHWLMALLFAWQFTSALLHLLARETAVAKFFWSTHFTVGLGLFVLVLLRGTWGLINATSRPPHGSSLVGRAAVAGHLTIYALMIVIPALAILRAYGRGRGLAVLDVEIFAATGTEVPALTAPGNALHSPLGWVLLALIAGHAAMSLVHRRVWNDDVIGRMTYGRSRPNPLDHAVDRA
jgi:cytochrome b561